MARTASPAEPAAAAPAATDGGPLAPGALAPGALAPGFEQRPVFGLPVVVPPPAPLALCFVRHLGSPVARDALARLQARFADFDRLGVRLVAVSQTDLRGAQDFVPRHHLLPALLVDDGTLHDAYGVAALGALASTLSRLRPGAVRQALGSLQHGVGRPAAVDRLPAEFLIGRDGRIGHARYGRGLHELPDLDALLSAARTR